MIDWIAIPDGTRAKRSGIYHAASNVVAILGFALVWWMRYNSGARVPTSAEFLLEVVALCMRAVGGWLGGELVDRFGVGVDNGANLNAPNCVSGKRAADRAAAWHGFECRSPLTAFVQGFIMLSAF